MQWLLVDGNSWFATDWYGFKGRPNEAFQRRLDTMLAQFDFARVAIAWDSKNSFRKELSAEYKTHRGAKPEGFEAALQKTKQAVAAAGVDCLECPGFEGDDVLATIVQVALDEGVRAVVCSADKDLHQLLASGTVSQVTSCKRATATRLQLKTVTEDTFFRQYGVRPWQWVDYRVIAGDKSDGIKGVDGLGQVAARDVITRCGTLEGFFRNPFAAGSLTDKQRQVLLKFKPNIERSRQLLTLRKDVPLPARWFQSIAEGPAR